MQLSVQLSLYSLPICHVCLCACGMCVCVSLIFSFSFFFLVAVEASPYLIYEFQQLVQRLKAGLITV